jgi:hypothetical protein
MVIAGREVVVPVYVGEAHAGGLGGELFAEFGGLPSRQQCKGFENDAMLGILPTVGAELRENGGTTGDMVLTGGGEGGMSAAESAKDSEFEVEHFRLGLGSELWAAPDGATRG